MHAPHFPSATPCLSHLTVKYYFDFLAHAPAPAEAPRPARIGQQAELAEAHRVDRLVHLDRTVGAVEDRAEGFRSVRIDAPATAADDQVVHDPALARARVDTAEIRVAPVREGTHRPLPQPPRHRPLDRVENAKTRHSLV